MVTRSAKLRPVSDLPTIVSLALAKVLVAVMFAAVGRRRPHPALRWWTAAWALDGLRHFTELTDETPLIWSATGIMVILGGYFLLRGSLAWADRPCGWGWLTLTGIVALVIGGAPFIGFDDRALWVPSGAFLAFTRARAALAIAGASGDRVLRAAAATGLLLLAASALAYPWFLGHPESLPWGSLGVTSLVVAIGFALMLLYFDRLREEAESQQSQLRSIFEGSGQNIAIYDDTGLIVRMNPSFASIIPPREPARIDESVVPDANERASFFRASDFSSRPVQRVRMRTRHAGLRNFDISVSSLPQENLYMVFAYDVSKQVALERELEDARRMEALGRVATGIAHDFNNILNVIKTYVGLGRAVADPADALQGILEATRRGERLTQKLLTVGKRQKVTARELRIDRLVRETAEWLEGILGDDFELCLEISDQPLVARADTVQVEQLLFNLVSNAREVMPEGGRIDVRARAHRDAGGHFIRLEVCDQGPGIPDEIRDRIFDPFFSTKETAAGLGLTTVQSIVRDRGWSLGVWDIPKGGTIFRIDIPMVVPESSDEHVSSSSDRPVPKVRLLLVDDNAPLVKIVARSLRHDGYDATAATTAGEALERLRRDAYDVLVTDLDMPGMDGRELMEQAWVFHPELRVIVASGLQLDLPDDPRVQMLEKPYSEQSLRECIDRFSLV